MEKKEKKSDLEGLLNSLIEKGWKPRGESEPIYMLSSKKLYIPDTREVNRSLRDLVSKESGLWQFVCENNLAPIVATEEWIKHYYKDIDDDNLISGENIQPTTEYEYYLIESALLDEDKLESFILDNVKIRNED